MAFGGPPGGSPWADPFGNFFGQPTASLEDVLRVQQMLNRSREEFVYMMAMAENSSQSGEAALKAGKLEQAEHLLQKAYSIYSQLQFEETEPGLCRVLRNLTLLHQRRGWYKMAKENAEELLCHNPDDFEANWLFGKCQQYQGELECALACYCDCISMTGLSQTQRVDCLVEITKLALKVKEEDLVEEIDATSDTWKRVLSKLSEENRWDVVRVLMGLSPVSNGVHGAALGCGAETVNVGALLSTLNAQALASWGQELAVALLKEGASVDSVRFHHHHQPLHVALMLGLQSGSLHLLKYLLGKLHTVPGIKNQVDVDGNSVYHVVVKSGKENTTVGETAVRLLLNHNLSWDIRDRDGKMAVDYLRNTDQVFSLLQSAAQDRDSRPVPLQPDDVLAKLERVRDAGRKCMKDQTYREALRQYTKGIQLASRQPELKHELAILYSNRAAAHTKLNNLKDAFEDAEACIANSPAWPKGYWRKGQVLKFQRRYIDAFITFHKGYDCEKCTDEAELCLVGAVTALPQIKDNKPFLKRLATVAKPVMSSVIKRLAKQSEWRSLSVLVVGGARSKSLNKAVQGASAAEVSLYELACLIEASPLGVLRWAYDLLLALIFMGAQPSTLVLDKTETMYHAALRLALHVEDIMILEVVVKTRSCQEEAKMAVNGKRETLLHCVVKSPKREEKIGYLVMKLLIWLGVDFTRKDLQGREALDYLPRTSQISRMYRGTPEKPAKKEASSKKERPKPPPKAKAPKDPCDVCASRLSAARDLHRKDGNVPAVESLCSLICVTSHGSPRHQQLRKDAIEEIIVIFEKSFRAEVPDSMTRLPEGVYGDLLRRLAQSNQWQQVESLTSAWRRHKPESRTIAAGLSAGDVIASDLLQSNPLYMGEVISVLLQNGACLQASPELSDEPITIAIARKNFRVIPVLLEHGAQPKRIRLAPGDTPLHVALKVALELDKGYFKLFETLLALFDKDRELYAYLDPKSTDKTGASLYHLACRCRYSSHAQRAVEMLCERRVSASVKDSSGRMPVDYISKPNDRRREYLRMASGFSQPSKKATSVSANDTCPPTPLSSTPTAPMHSQKKPDTEGKSEKQSEKKSADIKLMKGSKSYKEKCKEVIRKFISDLKDWVAEERVADEEVKVIDESKDVCEKNTQNIASEREESVESPCSVSSIDETGDGLHVVGDTRSDSDEDEPEADTDDGINADVFDDMEWEVECTAEVWKFLKNKRIPIGIKQRAIRRIQQLARGEWTDSVTKPVHNVPDTLKLFEAKISKGARILWERAIAFSPRLSEQSSDDAEGAPGGGAQIYTEVIRVWDIVILHDKLYHRIQRISRSHARGRDSILLQKLVRIFNEQSSALRDNVKYCVPEVFMLSSENTSGALSFYPSASPSEKEYHIVKFYSFSSALVSHILQQSDTKVDFPFKVTDMEHAIISLQPGAPLLLLGRSGTGKTTCCLYRLWHSFMRYWTRADQAGDPLLPRTVHFRRNLPSITEGDQDSSDADSEDDDTGESGDAENDELGEGSESKPVCCEEDQAVGAATVLDHLQQIFVTKNAVLCSEVMKNFQDLSHASSVCSKHHTGDESALPNRLQDVAYQMYPLFLTSHQLLLMLDASLPGDPFFERAEDGNLKREIRGWTDADSPLAFLAEFDSDSEDEEDASVAPNTAPTASAVHADPRQEVTYEVFAEELYPKMKQKVGYHPSLVWTEINSFIKGSFEALHAPSGHLTLEEYKELGRKRASNFTGERAKVYKMFERYEMIKKQRGLFDECDLLINIYRRLCKAETLGWVVHQIYVDETQDFTQAELCLLIALCQNPNDMFFTGDTAQGIMRGISFRFSDLKSLFFYAHSSLRTMGKHKAVRVPDHVYQLTHNYRSHAGILALASSTVDLMVEFFPETFDHLGKDQGLFHGPLPVLLESCSFGDLAVLLRGNRRQTSEIEFGAHQAILVVNDAARMALPEELRLGLVLTIFEAKGLEFDDVLLYNFFKDSQATKEWRVVTEYLQRQSSYSGSDGGETCSDNHGLKQFDLETVRASSCRPLTFDPDQHKVLCSELKHLYTALTRARVNVWIFDEDAEKRAPMFDYFKARQLVRTVSPPKDQSEGLAEDMFAETSSPSDWLKRGDDFMKHHLYEVAAKCYRKAKVKDKENVAVAHATALRATRLQETPTRMREEFLYAAELYLVNCGLKGEAARCLKNAKERELAARLYEKMGEMEKAGGLYKLCNLNYEASRCYEQHSLFKQAISVLCDINKYDMAIDVLNRYQMRVKEYRSQGRPQPATMRENKPSGNQTLDRLTYKAAGCHLKNNDEQKMLASLDRLQQPEDKVTFLKDHGRALLAVDVLKTLGHYRQAASILFEEGRHEEAMQCAEMAKDNSLVSHCLLASCRKKILAEDLTTMDPNDEQEKEKQSVIQSLKKLITYFTNARDLSEVCEVQLMLGQLTRDPAAVQEAWKMFSQLKPTPNEVGQVECSKVLLTMISLKDNGKTCCRFAREHFLCLLVALKVAHRASNNEELEKVKMYQRYYGFRSEETGSLVYYPKQCPKCRLFITLEGEESTTKISVDSAKQHLQRYLLKLVEIWVIDMRLSIDNILVENSLCPDFAAGRPCNKDLGCRHLHHPHTKATFLEEFYCRVSQVYIDGSILNAYFHIGDEGFKRQLGRLLPREVYNSFDSLVQFILPTRAHWKLFSRDPQLITQVFDCLRHSQLRKLFIDWQNWRWKCLKSREKVSITSVYVEGYLNCAVFLSSQKKVHDWMKEAQRISSDKVHQKQNAGRSSQGAAMISDGRGAFMCYARRFCEALEFLYQPKSEPEEALFKFGKFLNLLGNKGDSRTFPNYGQLLLTMEFFLMVDFCLGAKHTQQYLILPTSYISVIRFMDHCFAKQNIKPLFSIVKYSKLKNQKVLAQKIRTMIDLLVGKKEKDGRRGFSLLKDVFDPKSDHTESGVTERCWVFCLTLLSNVSGMVPEEYEDELRQAIHDPIPPHCKLPSRLKSVIFRTRRANGQREIVEALWAFLREQSNEDLLMCRWVEDSKKEPMVLQTLEESGVLDELPERFGTGSWQNNAYSVSDLEMYEDNLGQDAELGMSPAEIQQQQEEQRKEKAVIVLRKFFRWIRLSKRARALSFFVRIQLGKEVRRYQFPPSLLEVFDRCTVDDSMCGICGVQLCPADDTDVNTTFAEQNQSDGPVQTSTSPLPKLADVVSGKVRETRAAHVTSFVHRLRNREYESLCEFIHEELGPVLDGVRKVLKDKRELRDLDLDTGRLSKAREEVWKELKQLSERRCWVDVSHLKALTVKLRDQYTDTRQVREQNPRLSDIERKKHPSGRATEVSISEIEMVVDEPKLREVKGRRARKTRARRAKRETNR